LQKLCDDLEAKQQPTPSQDENGSESKSAEPVNEEELDKQSRLCKFYEEAVSFIKIMHQAVPILCKLLGSNNSTDVLESIEFFVAASNFKIENANDGVRKMLMLIWSKGL